MVDADEDSTPSCGWQVWWKVDGSQLAVAVADGLPHTRWVAPPSATRRVRVVRHAYRAGVRCESQDVSYPSPPYVGTHTDTVLVS